MAQKDNSLITFIRQNFFQIILALVTLGNIWIAYQLSPILGRLGAVEVKASQIEAEEKNLMVRSEALVLFEEGKTRDNDIIHRLDIISARLDRVISR